jgi:hypothetical protein
MLKKHATRTACTACTVGGHETLVHFLDDSPLGGPMGGCNLIQSDNASVELDYRTCLIIKLTCGVPIVEAMILGRQTDAAQRIVPKKNDLRRGLV